jgi:hypothetical protein
MNPKKETEPAEGKAWAKVRELIAKNARHRKGFLLSDTWPEFIISQAIEELEELEANPTNIDELADVFGCLIHYAIKQGWTEESLEQRIIEKLSQRFTVQE